jgi:hypothetical protein
MRVGKGEDPITTNGANEPRANTGEGALGVSTWQGMVNGLLYAIQFRPVLDAEEANEIADMVIDGRVIPGGPARRLFTIEGVVGV